MVDQPTDPTTPPEGGPIPQAVEPPQVPAPGDPVQDEPLGEGGMKALAAERKARAELETQLKALEPLNHLVEAIRKGQHVPEDEKTEIEKLSEQIQQLQAANEQERLGRLRLEVATASGLTPEQAARLQGASREELAADAEALKQLFPASQEPAGPRRPAPDPSQGGRGAPPDLQSQIAAAEAAGDFQLSMALKSQMLTNH